MQPFSTLPFSLFRNVSFSTLFLIWKCVIFSKRDIENMFGIIFRKCRLGLTCKYLVNTCHSCFLSLEIFRENFEFLLAPSPAILFFLHPFHKIIILFLPYDVWIVTRGVVYLIKRPWEGQQRKHRINCKQVLKKILFKQNLRRFCQVFNNSHSNHDIGFLPRLFSQFFF